MQPEPDAAPAPEPARRPGWARRLTLLTLGIAIVALGFTIHDIGLVTLVHYLRKIGWWWLAVIPMEVLCTTLDATAMRAFTSPDQHRLRLRSAVLAQLAGRAVNAVTPSGNLGELVKITVLTDFVSQSRAVSTILLYNVVGFCVEMLVVSVAAPVVALLVPMPPGVRWFVLGVGVVCLVISIGLYTLVRRGMLASVARLAVRLRILSRARFERWETKLVDVDDKMRLVAGARRRDRWIGIAAVTASRINSMVLSLMILYAVGESITAAFVAAYIVGGTAIYFASSLVPMGLGVSEGGYYWMYRALGENPARGVTLVLARRTVTIMYAAIGLLLVTTNETVKRAKQRQSAPATEGAPEPTRAPLVPVAVALRDEGEPL